MSHKGNLSITLANLLTQILSSESIITNAWTLGKTEHFGKMEKRCQAVISNMWNDLAVPN